MTARLAAVLFALATCVHVPPASAVTVDGQLDPEYGAAFVTQTLQTGLDAGQIVGDSNLGQLEFANGSELDGGYAIVSGGVLHLFLAGNLALVLNQNGNQTIGHVLDVFVDSAPGGQNTLNGLGSGHPLNGLTFDAGFEADYWFEFEGAGDQNSIDWRAGRAALSPGGGSLTTLGYGTAGGPGTLVGGTNPLGILATIDNRNTAGVTYGCNASSGAGATRGIEWAIPLAAIGNPAGCFNVTAIVRVGSSSVSPVSNSVLAPLPPGTCPPGQASLVNFALHAGDQFAAVCPTQTGVAPAAVAGLSLSLAGPNPGRGDRLRLAFRLPDARPATLRLCDLAGRVVREREVSGSGVAELAGGAPLPPGLYWARLSLIGSTPGAVAQRVCVIR